MEEKEKDYLLIDEVYAPVTEDDFENLQPIVEDFVESYEQNQDRPVEDWLSEKLHAELPDKTQEEVQNMAKEIVESVRTFESTKESLSETLATGRSKESWFAEQVKTATSRMSVEQTVQYLQSLDNAVNTANEALTRTIMTQAGQVSLNPSLNGFIAEQEHVQSFNMNAAARGSEYRARVLEPNGQGYAKNSVDMVIEDANGKVVKRYQAKYCRDAEATQKAFEHGDYRGQQSLAPEEQIEHMTRKATDHMEAPDGTCSNPLTKERAVQMQEEARSGKWNDKNWNSYKTKDIAVGIGKQAGQAALLGAAIGASTEVVEKLWKGEKIEGKVVAKKALEGGADFGIKAAITGAIKAGAEKGVIKCIPKGTPAGAIANVVFVGVENAKILYKYGKGEINGSQALAKMEETTVSAAGGMIAMGYGATIGATKGAAWGAALGSVVPGVGNAIGATVGAAIGGFVGGTVAYMAGSAAGKVVVEARRKVTSVAKKVASSVIEKSRSAVTAVTSTVASVGRGIASAVSALKFW